MQCADQSRIGTCVASRSSLSLSLCVSLFLGSVLTRQSGAANSSSPSISFLLHLTSRHILLQLHSILSLHFVPLFLFHLSAQSCPPYRLVESGLSAHDKSEHREVNVQECNGVKSVHSPSAWASFAPKLTTTLAVAGTKSYLRRIPVLHYALTNPLERVRVVERHDTIVQILVNVIVALHDAL